MKKKLVCMLLLGTCLTSCVPMEGQSPNKSEVDTNSPSVEAPVGEDTRIAYYEELVGELRQELLSIKTELYVNRVEYESRIEELKKEIESGSSTVSPPVTDSDAPSSVHDFTYILKDGGIIITAYTGTDKTVTVPAEIDGHPVREIGERAFFTQTRLTSVILPDGLEKIGWFAFSGCVALGEISIPASVGSIGYGALENCNSTLCVQCPEGSYAQQYARSYGIVTKS